MSPCGCMPLYRNIHINNNGINLPGISINNNGINLPGISINNNGINLPGISINSNPFDSDNFDNVGYTEDSVQRL
jgi:hypothetical protein